MKVLIIEDEPQAADVLSEIIGDVYPAAQVMGVLQSIEQAIAWLSLPENQPELIFMDIQLADGISFEIFSRVEVACPVIFCTAFDQYTLQAFKSNGIEYILKPVKEEDIRAAFAKVEKLKNAFGNGTEMLNTLKNVFTEKKSYKTSILIRYRESYIPVAIEDIALFILENEVVYAYRFDQQKHAIFKTLEELESSLDPEQFYRINRQVLISRRAVQKIQPYFNRKMVIRPPFPFGEKLIVSRLKVSPFMRWMEQA
ncbi:LytTR family DNA-binding domain-containing protein [Prolixibacter sp. SD074]|uniref:LytR/AlgR family response regulator transcription factor n=1 Tax=Prolixibacter sp. SD074 TaxID=2652391 RepID=UPI00126FA7A9|nr:LytTR family DNA-binding domain-containing protein [Prolixibacter sp. SD074]GET29207.1 DNA-binding response regulator [Prolixibacter sp. SD074]